MKLKIQDRSAIFEAYSNFFIVLLQKINKKIFKISNNEKNIYSINVGFCFVFRHFGFL